MNLFSFFLCLGLLIGLIGLALYLFVVGGQITAAIALSFGLVLIGIDLRKKLRRKSN